MSLYNVQARGGRGRDVRGDLRASGVQQQRRQHPARHHGVQAEDAGQGEQLLSSAVASPLLPALERPPGVEQPDGPVCRLPAGGRHHRGGPRSSGHHEGELDKKYHHVGRLPLTETISVLPGAWMER